MASNDTNSLDFGKVNWKIESFYEDHDGIYRSGTDLQYAGARLTKYGRVFKSSDDKAEYKAAFKKVLKNPMKKSLQKKLRKLKKSNTEKINEVVCEAILYSEFD